MAAHLLFWEDFMVSALSAVKTMVSFEENKFETNRARTVSAVWFFHQRACVRTAGMGRSVACHCHLPVQFY